MCSMVIASSMHTTLRILCRSAMGVWQCGKQFFSSLSCGERDADRRARVSENVGALPNRTGNNGVEWELCNYPTQAFAIYAMGAC